MKKISDRYKKALVTVAMGFRTEEDIRKNGLYRFTKKDIDDLISFTVLLFNKNKSVLVLKVKQIGYYSEHININSKEELDKFIKNINNRFSFDDEYWVIESSVEECWRCRVYLSNDGTNDLIEMAYSYDDHILDNININSEVPYISYKLNNNEYKILNTNLDEVKKSDVNLIISDILFNYFKKFNDIREDLKIIKIKGISLDIRVNNGYDFHDFDVSYKEISKVVDYYFSQLKLDE